VRRSPDVGGNPPTAKLSRNYPYSRHTNILTQVDISLEKAWPTFATFHFVKKPNRDKM
jgi:hypothetical protein